MQDLDVLDHLATVLFNAVLFIIHLEIVDRVISILFMLGLGQHLHGDNDLDIDGSLFVLFRALAPNLRHNGISATAVRVRIPQR